MFCSPVSWSHLLVVLPAPSFCQGMHLQLLQSVIKWVGNSGSVACPVSSKLQRRWHWYLIHINRWKRKLWNKTPLTYWPQTCTQKDFPVPCPQMNYVHNKELSEEVRQINVQIRTFCCLNSLHSTAGSRTTICILLKSSTMLKFVEANFGLIFRHCRLHWHRVIRHSSQS